MASPFRVFRKYQKTLLVVAGVVLMFVFVIGDALMGYLSGSRRGRGDATRDAGATAVRWDGGSLTNTELHNLVVRRRIVKAFVLGVWAAGERSAIEAGIEPRPLRVEPIFRPDTPETPQQGVERHVVQTRLFADAARETGLRVSDDTIVQYLLELGRGNVSPDDMRAMLARMQSGVGGATIDFVIDALREEMLARNYIASHQFAFETVTPQERWADWLKVNDRVVIEAAAMPIEQFLVDVPEPGEAELSDLFDKFKNRDPQPDFVGQVEIPSPTPGFHVPRKIDVQFIRASYDEYLAKIEDEISDEQIRKYYDENKDPLFIKADTGLIDEPGDQASDDEPSTESADTTESGAKPSDDPATMPADGAPAPAEPSGDSQEPSGETAPAEGDQSSSGEAGRRGPVRLAAFLQESDAEPADDTETNSPDADSQSADEPMPPDPEASAPDTETPAATDESEAGESPAAKPAGEEKPIEFQPLDEVRDLIRRQLAEQRAAEELNQVVNELAGQLNSHFNAYFGQMLDARAAERDPPPPPDELADLAPLAKEHGLEAGRTGPMDLLELRESDVGRSGSAETGVELWRTFFGNRDLEKYQPVVSVDIDGNRYVAIKMSDTPGREPKLADVKDEVVRAWRRQEAAKRALKHAEEEAEKAKEAGATLGDHFAGNQSVDVIRTDPFSEYTGGDVALVGGDIQQQPFRLSQPDGIVAPGPEFLRSVFELEDNQVGAVLNHDHSIAYVIRIVEHMSSPEELRSAYLAEAGTWPGLRLMLSGHARIAAAYLVNDIVAAADLKWVRPADEIEEDAEAAG